MQSPFRVQRISNIGSTHPVVARLGVQVSRLEQWIGLDEKPKQELVTLYAKTLTMRLLRCDELRGQIVERLEGDIARVEKLTTSIPFVVGLDSLVESFLYDGKNFLRDLLNVTRIAFGCKLKDARAFADTNPALDGELTKWAIKKFGENAGFVNMLRNNADWLRELIAKRNASEHPGERSGVLTVNNVQGHPLIVGAFTMPTWSRDGAAPTEIVNDMDVLLGNLLELAEYMFLWVLAETKTSAHVAIFQIPEAERDPACPVRFRADLSPELSAKLRAADVGTEKP
ncbi:hypothetical protein NKI09_07095 [Mesorhizobium sp. M0757]|uniref:hypothetical protein n=1 Tax=Mesorhizobium sp. M0757 TaxID=2956993 RepID=UPI00333C8B80